jgi:hypothetical protein
MSPRLFTARVLIPLETFRRRVKVRFVTEETDPLKILEKALREAEKYYGSGVEVEKVVEER